MNTGSLQLRNSRQEASGSLESTLALVLAGGSGSSLGALARWEPTPALPFGGQYRTVDFALSNAVSSGIRRVAILTQYKAHTLIQHVQQGWQFLRPEIGELIEVWPAQQRRNANWYAGTADAVYQNIDLIERLTPERVLILAGDHVYRMDYRPMLDAHMAAGLGATIGCIEVPLASAAGLGVLATDSAGRVRYFADKPARPPALEGRPDAALVSMGIYVFDRDLLIDCLHVDAEDPTSSHDFGHDVLPMLIRSYGAAAFPFRDARSGRAGYWRDVGTADSFWQANLELLADAPQVDLHDRDWPICVRLPQRPPARFVGEGRAARSIVASGCWVAGQVEESVLSADCVVEHGAAVRRSVVLPEAKIGRGCRITNAVIGAGCVLPDGTIIGENRQADAMLCQITPLGVAVVTREMLERRGVAPRRNVA
ncbi:MAG TPA: glucose-1-phosphate adenylyltransferase [Gammaproteobacteria bacterium]|nr:glucose-1-phosphate adenylyltransferase [Gammaproteobacteria bacterium]